MKTTFSVGNEKTFLALPFWLSLPAQLSTFFYHQLIENEKLKSCAADDDDDDKAAAATVTSGKLAVSQSHFEQQLKVQNQQQLNMRKSENKSLRKLLCKPQVYKPLIILLFAFLFQQFSGCYILIFYTINIFRNLSLNFSERVNENMALMLLGTLRLIMSVIASGYESLNENERGLCHLSSIEGGWGGLSAHK